MPSNPFYETYMDKALKALNAAGVVMPDVPETIRQETFHLESLIMMAEQKGDVIKFMAIVNKWRDLFLTCKPTEPVVNLNEKEKKPWQHQQKEMKQLNLFT